MNLPTRFYFCAPQRKAYCGDTDTPYSIIAPPSIQFPATILLAFLQSHLHTYPLLTILDYNAPLAPTTTTSSSSSHNTFPTPSHPHLPLHMLNPPPRNPLHNLTSPRPRPPFQRPRQNPPFTTPSYPRRRQLSTSNIIYHHHHHHGRPQDNRRETTTTLSIITSARAATCKEIHYGAARRWV